jgi:CBS domain containing-hemolysin-like protein
VEIAREEDLPTAIAGRRIERVLSLADRPVSVVMTSRATA